MTEQELAFFLASINYVEQSTITDPATRKELALDEDIDFDLLNAIADVEDAEEILGIF